MSAPIYLGDDVGAAGYRLAGARLCTPAAGEARAALAKALEDAPLVLVSAAMATQIGQTALLPALAGDAPLVLVVPDADGSAAPADVAARMRAQLGLEA
jgi:vacuolar-type H+-ATPase subunit F/Vma7